MSQGSNNADTEVHLLQGPLCECYRLQKFTLETQECCLGLFQLLQGEPPPWSHL